MAALLAGAACVSSSDIDALHRQMNDIQKQIQALERKSSSKEEVEKLNQNVATQTQQLLKSNADTAVKLGELTTKMEQLEAKLEDTNRRLSQLSQQIAETQGDLLRLRNAPPAAPPRRRSPRAGRARRRRAAHSAAAGPSRPSSTTRLTPTTQGPLCPRRPGLRGLPVELPVHRPLRQRAVLDRRVALRAEEVPGGDRRLREAPEAVAGERQGRGRAPEEGLRDAGARPEGRGRRPAPVRHPRVPPRLAWQRRSETLGCDGAEGSGPKCGIVSNLEV